MAAPAPLRRIDLQRPAASRVARDGAALPGGGLIAIGGPPLGGKSVLAARLAECIPDAIRLEAVDDLSRSEPYWPAEPGSSRRSRDPTAALLARARQLCRTRRAGRHPTVLVVTRFGSGSERRRAMVAARLADVRFLFVEAQSRDEYALRRIPSGFLSADQLAERLERYAEAKRRYCPIDRKEALILPAIRLRGVQSRLDKALERVLATWSAR